MKDRKKLVILAIIVIMLSALFIFSGLTEKNFEYVLSKRIPKIYAMILTGGAIGYSSLIFQTLTKNRILTPSILGLDSLYMLLNTVLIFCLGSTNILMLDKNINFLLTMGVMLLMSIVFYKLLFNKRNHNIFFLLLVGIVVGTLFDSLTSFMQVLIDPVAFLSVQDKMMASFNNINTKVLSLTTLIILLAVGYSLRYMRILDVMALGRDQAINLGVDYDHVVKRLLVVVVILTAASTALVGPVTFLGLLVVNIARHLVKTYKHSVLSISTWLISALALVGSQILVERILNFSMSISVIINFLGGICFIYLLMKERT